MVKKNEENEQVDLTKLKKELKNYVKERLEAEDIDLYLKSKIDKEVNESMEKVNKKIIKGKNRVILRKNIIIIILILICFFLAYNLYTLSNINIDITKTDKKDEVTETKKEKNVTKEKKESIDKKYIYLINKIMINENSSYIEDFYNGNLTDEVKLNIAFNNLDRTSITKEDDSVYVDNKDLEDAYEDLFMDEYSPKSFNYDKLKFIYLKSKGIFLAQGNYENKLSNIRKEILKVTKDDEIEIKVVEGLIKDDKLYNVLTKEKVKNYDSDKKISEYKDDLNMITYVFEKDDDDYKLSKIKKN